MTLDVRQIRLGDLGAFGELLRSLVGGLADDQALEPHKGVVLNDPQLVGEVFFVALQFVIDDLLRAREYLHVDHRARHARQHAQAGVLHIGRLLAENCAQQLLFRRELGFAFRRHLADQHVAGLDFCADVYDARLVQAGELRFRQV